MKSFKETLTESKKVDERSIDFENIGGGLEVRDGYDGIRVQCYTGGKGYNREWKSEEYKKLLSEKDWNSISKMCEKVLRDLLPVCDRFDRELEAVMKKYGFKK